jgi:hypothetical protein
MLEVARDRAKLFGMQDVTDSKRGDLEEFDSPHSIFFGVGSMFEIMR